VLFSNKFLGFLRLRLLNESKLLEEEKLPGKNFYDFAFYANRIVQEVFPLLVLKLSMKKQISTST
jgi:hypothetical protein